MHPAAPLPVRVLWTTRVPCGQPLDHHSVHYHLWVRSSPRRPREASRARRRPDRHNGDLLASVEDVPPDGAPPRAWGGQYPYLVTGLDFGAPDVRGRTWRTCGSRRRPPERPHAGGDDNSPMLAQTRIMGASPRGWRRQKRISIGRDGWGAPSRGWDNMIPVLTKPITNEAPPRAWDNMIPVLTKPITNEAPPRK